jgi:putative transposase
LQYTEDDGRFVKKVYQFKALNKSIKGIVLNIVVVQSWRKIDGKCSTSIWFSNDLTITAKTLLDYYALRFQIEFEFRDAKQHFGLSDFKNYKPQNLTNFVNLSFFVCLLSKPILAQRMEELKIPKFSIIDLKTLFYQRFVAINIYKLIQCQAVSISLEQLTELLRPTDLVNAA